MVKTYEGVHMGLNYIKGVNLGNWLVLEKWMNPALFDGTTADDEYYLPTQLDPAVYEARINASRRIHQRTRLRHHQIMGIEFRTNSGTVFHLRRSSTVHWVY